MSYFQFTFFYFPLSSSLVGPFSDMAMGLPILCFSTSEALQTVSSFSEGLNWLNFFTFLLRRCVFQNLSNFWSVLKCKFQSRTHCVGFSPNSVEAIFLCLTQSIPIFSMELKWFFFPSHCFSFAAVSVADHNPCSRFPVIHSPPLRCQSFCCVYPCS